MNNKKIILDLCSGTGSWSIPYENSEDYKVVRVDADDEKDVRLFHRPWETIHGILAAPPCTCFAASGARWKRSDLDMVNALSIVDACVRLITFCKPKWWALENPIGILRRYIGPPKMMYDPCDYGDPWTKKTCLWGEFNIPKKNPVIPILESRIHNMSSSHKAHRALTPIGFSKAFFEANP